MATQKQIPISRVNRQNITELVPNNNSADILRDYLFGVDARTLTISVTDPHDTPSITSRTIAALQISVTDSKDTSELTADTLISIALSVIENNDISELNADAVISIIISAIESIDELQFIIGVLASLTLEAQGATDTALINATTGIDRNARINAIENGDIATINALHQSVEKNRTYIPLSHVNYLRYERERYASMAVKEKNDSVIISVKSENLAMVAISENTDGILTKSSSIIFADMIVKDSRDGIQNDEVKFHAWAKNKRRQHEQDAMIKILLSA